VEDPTASRSAQPRSLIVTIYGAYAREAGGWLSVAALIRLMEALGVDEPAVRSSISRLKRRGILVADRLGGAAGYGLSARAREILAEGDRRIFHRRVATLKDGWVLAVFSVPETQRSRRHTLRSRLSWLGFGSVAPGVWIAPAHLADETRDVLTELGLVHSARRRCRQPGSRRGALVEPRADPHRLRGIYRGMATRCSSMAAPPSSRR
jgi:phenylacetic acid degradation operon negative regulatory protein